MAGGSEAGAWAVGGRVGGLGGAGGGCPLLFCVLEAGRGGFEGQVGRLVGVVVALHGALVRVGVFFLVVEAVAGAGGAGMRDVCEVEAVVSVMG